MLKRSIYFLVFFAIWSEYVSVHAQQIWEPASTSSEFKKFRALQIFHAGGDTIYAIKGTDQNHLFADTTFGKGWFPASNIANITGFAMGSKGRYYTSSISDGIDTSFNPICDLCGGWSTLPRYGLTSPMTALFVRSAGDESHDDELWVGTDSGLFYRRFVDTVWVQKDNSAMGDPIQQITANGKNIYYRTNTSVFVSNDGGTSWNDKTPVNFGSITSLIATSETEAFISVTTPQSSSVYHSSSAGEDLFTNPTPPYLGGQSGRSIRVLTVNDAGDLFLGGGITNPNPNLTFQGYVLKFSHNGFRWQDFSDGLPGDSGRSSEVISIGFSADQTIFAGTDSQGVFRTALKSGVKEERIANGVTLNQNYPNPANTLTSFSIVSDRALIANIGIFDPLGRKMFELGENVLSPGEHSFTIDTKNLSSGTYFYRLQTQEGILSRMFVVAR